VKFRLIFTAKVSKELKQLPLPVQKQYDKAFQLMTAEGPSYRSLRTHRYKCKNAETWTSSASMALRFYWEYQGEQTILVMAIDSH
jgi:hypothetical protein